MTLWLAAPYAAVALLVVLLTGLGSRVGAPGGQRPWDGRRVVSALLAGCLAFYFLLSLLDALHLGWQPWLLVGAPGLALFATRRWPTGRPAGATDGVGERLGWGDLLALVAVGVLAASAVSLCSVTVDFFLAWGVKGERFFLASGTDYSYLAWPWNHLVHPDYPNLLPDLYAASALVAGRFSAAALMVWSVVWFAVLLLAGREALRGQGARGFLGEAALGVTALCTAAAGIRGHMTGGADWMVALALVAAMPALLGPPNRTSCFEVGVAAAFAATAKIEGIALGGILVLVQGLRGHAAARARHRLDLVAASALCLPLAAVVIPWYAKVLTWHLATTHNGSGIHLDHTRPILLALRYEFFTCPTWHGFTYSLLLLPLLFIPRRLRAVGAVLGLQLLTYLYAYYAVAGDPVPLVITTFERLQLHLIPAILLACGIAIAPLGASTAPHAEQCAPPALAPRAAAAGRSSG